MPVPTVWWCEPDPAALGAPFFVMSRVDGRVPPDIMPYNFGDSWLYDADPADQRHLQDATVDVLARLHAVDRPAERFSFLAPDDLRRHPPPPPGGGDPGLVRVRGGRRASRSPLVERGFAWLDEHWPADEGEAVLSWGDSRIGNMMFDDFDPVAVLDWEMAGIGPRELDVAWLDLRPPHLRGPRRARWGSAACPTSCATTTWPPPTSG